MWLFDYYRFLNLPNVQHCTTLLSIHGKVVIDPKEALDVIFGLKIKKYMYFYT